MSCSEPGLVGRARATSRARRGRAMGQRPGGDHGVGGVAVVGGAGLDAGVAAQGRPEPLPTGPGLDQAGEIREACDVRRRAECRYSLLAYAWNRQSGCHRRPLPAPTFGGMPETAKRMSAHVWPVEPAHLSGESHPTADRSAVHKFSPDLRIHRTSGSSRCPICVPVRRPRCDRRPEVG